MSSSSNVLVPADQKLEARHLLQSIAAVELYKAQIEVAKYLELAYLGVCDHPQVAKEVRLTANSARTQHMMTTGLMKSFMVTAKHIVGTLIPMMFDAVDLEDKDLVKDCFAQVITRAEEMRQEAKDTRQQYYVIQTQVQQNLGLVEETNKNVKDRQAEIKIQQETAKKMAEDSARAEKELEEEKAKMEEEMKGLKAYRDKWMEESEKANEKMKESNEQTFLDNVFVPPNPMLGTPGVIKSMLETGVNVIGSIFGRNKEEKHFKNMMQGFKDSQASVEKMSDEMKKVLREKQEQRQARHERLAEIKRLNVEKASLGDAKSLAEASARLGDVDRQFVRIIEFWDNMVATLKFLKDDTQAGEVYLKKIENPKYAERFRTSITRAEQGWQGFGKICGDYVFTCENDEQIAIKVLYNFLSASIDDVPEHVRERRMRAIEDEIEENID